MQLATDSNTVLAQSLSDSRGVFVLRAPAPGQYRLRALRLGFRPSIGERFMAGQGTTERSIVLTGAAVTLAVQHVTAREKCASGSDPNSLGFRAWEQARTALTASLLTRQAATYEMRFVTAELRRDARADSVISYSEKEAVTSAMRPFHAMTVERLRDSGYVTRGENVITYAAPDEEVLLSEEFAASHCIRAIASSAEDVTLGFEPTRDRKLSDVAGTLVIARSTGELRRLAYEYANVSSEERAAHAGGVLDFLRFPSGGWMVVRWIVRAPAFEIQERRAMGGTYVGGGMGGGSYVGGASQAQRRYVLTAMQESRGEAFRVQQNGALVWAAPTVSLRGVVLDDSVGSPVAGADVRIAGRASGARSDERGRFVLDSVRVGDVILQVAPTYAIELGVPPTRTHLTVEPGLAETTLRVGSPDRVIDDACRAASQPLSNRAPRSIVRGIVRDAHGGRGSASDVSATWMHGAHAALEQQERKSRSMTFGDYVVCGIELGKEVDVRAYVGNVLVASGKTILQPGKPWVTLDLLPPVTASP